MTGPGRRWLPVVATAAFAFAGGVAVGGHRVSAPVSPAGAGTSVVARGDGTDTAQTSAAGPTNQSDRRETGAVRAAVALTTAFDGIGLLDDRRRDSLLAEHAAAGHRDELARTLGEVARLIQSGLGADITQLDSPEFVWRSVPAGVRVESFTSERAVVAVWGTGVVVARGRPLVQPGWRTTQVEMVWEHDAWRLIAFRSESGPEPPAVSGTPDSALQARLINGFAPLPTVVDQTRDAG